MTSQTNVLYAAAVAAVVAATPALADALRSNVAFNTGIGEKTANQPAGGVEVSYQVTLEGGDLDGCTVDIVEALHPRDDGAWGIFDIEGEVTCDGGGFSYASSGSWDGNGFHASGTIESGSAAVTSRASRVVSPSSPGAWPPRATAPRTSPTSWCSTGSRADRRT